MEGFPFGAPVPGGFAIDVGFAFVASMVGFIVAAVPAVLAARYAIDARGVRGLVPKLFSAEVFGRESRRAA